MALTPWSYDFTGTNGAAWNTTYFGTPYGAGTSVVDIQGNQGRMVTAIGYSFADIDVNSAYRDADFDIYFDSSGWSDLTADPFVNFNFRGSLGFSLHMNSGQCWTKAGSYIKTITVVSTDVVHWHVKAVGTAVYWSTWLNAASEPGTWDYTGTDTTYNTTAGPMTFEFQNSGTGAGATVAQTAYFDNIVMASPVTVPAAPTGLTVTAGNGSLALAWTTGSDGGSAITDYVAQYSTDNVTWSTWSHTASTTPTATITGLSAGTLYYLRVAEVNAIGTGAYGTTVTATTFNVPSTPSAPVAEVSHLGSHLTFTLPQSDSPITGATARYSSDSGSTWTTSSAVMTYTGELSVTGLTAGTSYIFQIKVTSAVGDSAWSPSSAAVVPRNFAGALLLENGSKLLLENGSKLRLV